MPTIEERVAFMEGQLSSNAANAHGFLQGR